MKKNIYLLFFAVVFAAGSLAAQQLTRFAVVDLSRVYVSFFAESREVRDFEARSARVQTEIDRMTAEINTLRTNLITAEFQGNQTQAVRLEAEINRKSEYLREYYQLRTAELERQRAALSQSSSFLNQVHDEIRYIAESEGYTMVLNLKENTGIVWYSPSVDITDKVINSLRTRR